MENRFVCFQYSYIKTRIPKVSSELNSGTIESNNQSQKFSEIIPEYLNFMRKNKRRLS